MRTIKESEIVEEFLACPYCGGEASIDDLGCCGESSGHFQQAYELKDGDVVMESEVDEIIEDLSLVGGE